MTELQTFNFSSVKVQSICVDGDPWFRGLDIAEFLGYANTRKAIRDHVDDEDKRKLEELLGGNESFPLDINAKNSVFINEPGLYSLVTKSKKPEAKAFKRWVYSEVLPQIRKTGAYSLPGHYSSNNITWSDVRKKAIGREDALHYKVIKHIRDTYPDAITTPSLGEHLVTEHQRKDSFLKGYEGGQPDIMVTRGLPNGNQDVVAIELKNPNGKGNLSTKQAEYHERLWLQCRIETIVSSNYDDVVAALQKHYQKAFATAELLAIADKEEYDFSSNRNPNHWVKKLNKTALARECDKRGLIFDNIMTTMNATIIGVLIAADSNRSLAE